LDRFINTEARNAARHRDPKAAQNLFALVFVDFHRTDLAGPAAVAPALAVETACRGAGAILFDFASILAGPAPAAARLRLARTFC
jgi:hypothetical protein